MKKLLIIFAVILIFSAGLYASRNSDDIVTASNSAYNNYIQDVIGNKTDTSNGKSIVASSKRLNAKVDIITIDGVTNEKILKTNQNRLGVLLECINKASLVYPTLAAGAIVNTDLGNTWTLSNGTTNQIVPGTTITSMFDIYYLSIEDLSANGIYEIVLYDMTAKTELGRARVTKNAAQDGTMNVPIQTPLIPANAKIGARMGCSVANTTVTMSIFYHEH